MILASKKLAGIKSAGFFDATEYLAAKGS